MTSFILGETIESVPFNKMNTLPHRHIGALISVGPGSIIQYGTGTLISKDLVLTCASVIYNKEHQDFYPKIVFYPKLSGNMEKWHIVE